MKKFRIDGKHLKTVAFGYGACIASDRITTGGLPVGYAYREEGDHAVDSGWRFFAGDEDQAYADDATNFAYYDVNTIANYDPDVLEIIEAPPGSAFERGPSGGFVPVPDPSED